jgi:hypothetical protein
MRVHFVFEKSSDEFVPTRLYSHISPLRFAPVEMTITGLAVSNE